jgi:hypothetical protein
MKLPVRTSVMDRSRGVVVLVALGALAALASCASFGGTTRDEFAKGTSCPPDRVSVVARPDYRVPLSNDPPPPEVAADASRLDYWQKQREATRDQFQRDCTWYEATGCGRQVVFCCEYPVGDHGEVLMSSPSCMPWSALRPPAPSPPPSTAPTPGPTPASPAPTAR